MQECKINFYCLRHLVRPMRGRHSSTSFKRTLVSNMKKKNNYKVRISLCRSVHPFTRLFEHMCYM